MADCNTCTDCSQVPTGPICPDLPDYTNNVCPDTVSSSCVEYEGPSEPCLALVNDDPNKKIRVTSVLRLIINYIVTFLSRITSNSLSITRNGDCGDSLSIEVIPSADINNTFVLGTDSKPFVKKVETNIGNSECISFQKQVLGSVTTFVPIIDFNCFSAKVCGVCQGTAIPCIATPISISSLTQTGASITFTVDNTKTYNVLLNNVQIATSVTSPYAITGLTAGTNYNVTLVTDCGSGNTSQTIGSFSTLPVVLCNVPLNLQIESI